MVNLGYFNLSILTRTFTHLNELLNASYIASATEIREAMFKCTLVKQIAARCHYSHFCCEVPRALAVRFHKHKKVYRQLKPAHTVLSYLTCSSFSWKKLRKLLGAKNEVIR